MPLTCANLGGEGGLIELLISEAEAYEERSPAGPLIGIGGAPGSGGNRGSGGGARDVEAKQASAKRLRASKRRDR